MPEAGPPPDGSLGSLSSLRVVTAIYEVDSSRGLEGGVNIDFDPFRIDNPTGNPSAGRLRNLVTIGPDGRYNSTPAVFVSIIGFSQFDERVSTTILGPRPTEEDPSQKVIVEIPRLDRDSVDITWDTGASKGELQRLSILVAGEVPSGITAGIDPRDVGTPVNL